MNQMMAYIHVVFVGRLLRSNSVIRDVAQRRQSKRGREWRAGLCGAPRNRCHRTEVERIKTQLQVNIFKLKSHSSTVAFHQPNFVVVSYSVRSGGGDGGDGLGGGGLGGAGLGGGGLGGGGFGGGGDGEVRGGAWGFRGGSSGGWYGGGDGWNGGCRMGAAERGWVQN